MNERKKRLMKKILLKVDGMTCSACSSGLEKYLKKQKGIKEGLEKGIEKGMKEGTQRAQLKIARNMKAKGIDNESIAECTDLPLSIIEGL